jgi:hypothetical protein
MEISSSLNDAVYFKELYVKSFELQVEGGAEKALVYSCR